MGLVFKVGYQLCFQNDNLVTIMSSTSTSIFNLCQFVGKDVCGFQIKMGIPLMHPLLEDQLRPYVLEQLASSFRSKPFMIIPVLDADSIFVTLHENIKPTEVIEAYVRTVFTAMVISQIRSKDKNESPVCLSLSSVVGGVGDICV